MSSTYRGRKCTKTVTKKGHYKFKKVEVDTGGWGGKARQ